MSVVNDLMARLVGLILAPFASLPPIVGLLVVSALTSVIMLLVFKYTSNQPAMDAIKRKIHASLFEIRLFNDDLRLILRAQFDILRHNATYVRLSLVPLLWMIVPITLLIAQLQFFYGYEAIRPGDRTMVKATLKQGKEGFDKAAEKPAATLKAPPGVTIASDPVWVPSLGEMAWNVAADKEGTYELELDWAGQTYTKSIDVSASRTPGRRSPERLERSLLNQILYPAEAPLPAESPLESIVVKYADAEVGAFGWETHWMIVFFLLSIVLAFALRKPFGVTI